MSEQAHQFLYYSTSLDESALQCVLEGEEHHHASRVLRMRPGDEAFVTNGRGVVASCEISSVDRDTTSLAVKRSERAPVSPPRVTLAVALLRRDAFELVVRQGTEVGVTRFVPFVAEKSHLRDYSKKFIERLEKIALAAMKQSFRAVLPDVESPRTFAQLDGLLSEHAVNLVGEAAAPRPGPIEADNVTVIVGPEGGLTEGELAALRESGARPVSAVPGRLRAETAAIALAAAVRANAA